MNYKNLAHKVFSFLEARSLIGGLEVSDTALRFVTTGSNVTAMVRLNPGTLIGGRIQDEAGFRVALAELRRIILGPKATRDVSLSVIVVMSSSAIYSQVFSLPLLKDEELEKAVDLNLKMAMPEAQSSYAGWQVIAEDQANVKLEVLSAFIDKNTAEEITLALRKAKFEVFAIESRALALARLARMESRGFDPHASALIVAADAEGLDMMILRNSNLQFNYFHSWNDLRGAAKEMSLEDFKIAIGRNLNQVINFYGSHWKDQLQRILVTATGLQDEIISAIKAESGVMVQPLLAALPEGLTADWFIAYGAALRGRIPRQDDREISLLGVDAQEEYHREVVDHFLDFWRVLPPAILAVLLVIIGGSFLFLGHIKNSVESQTVLRLGSAESREIDALKAEVVSFNAEVALAQALTKQLHPQSPLLQEMLDLSARRNTTIRRLTISPGSQVKLEGYANSEEDIRGMKNELSLEPNIKDVALPITEIRKDGDRYSFAITFTTN